MTTLTMVEAINAALRDSMARDERVLVFGEDVGRQGGVFRVTEGLARSSVRRGASTPRWPSPRSSA
jgi:pyruvate dehydrogenase E1 component beta subunit